VRGPSAAAIRRNLKVRRSISYGTPIWLPVKRRLFDLAQTAAVERLLTLANIPMA
jgi:hypothetical protein